MTILATRQAPVTAPDAPEVSPVSCPVGWCVDHTHHCHMGAIEHHDGQPVSLIQTDVTPYVVIGTQVWNVTWEAAKAADLLARFGHPEAAAAVTRLASLAAS